MSGGQRGLLDLVGALDRNLFDPVVVVQGSGDLKRGLEKSGVRCISRRMEPFRNRWLPYSWAIGVKLARRSAVTGAVLTVTPGDAWADGSRCAESG